MNNNYLLLFKRIWVQLKPRRRMQFILLLGLMGLNGLTEIVGLGMVLPFLSVLVTPDVIVSNQWINYYMSKFGITAISQLLFVLMITFLVATVVAAVMRLLLLWANNRITMMVASDLNIELFKRSLYQPYVEHLSRNSSELISAIGTKVANITQVLNQICMLLSASIVLLLIMLSLFFIVPIVVISAVMISGLMYLSLSYIIKGVLRKNGQIIADEAPKQIKILQEGLGGIRDVLLGSLQNFYINAFAHSDNKIFRAKSGIMFANLAPRHILEAIGIIFIVLLSYWMIKIQDMGEVALPVLGALVLGTQRVLPALQTIYSAWVSIVSCEPSVTNALDLLDQPMPEEAYTPKPSVLKFDKHIELRSIMFKYQEVDTPVLHNFSVKISKGDRIGIVGTTGGGKSTLLDILTGLLLPSDGQILVDGVPITKTNRLAWRQCISHVPQNIFLSDATIAENIALGKVYGELDFARVKRAAEQAKINDDIESRPMGYHTEVGERGIRFSGGQRQRLAIARALYKNSQVLILDESTSGLDDATEKAVLEAVLGLSKELTIIMIAHRTQSLRNFHRIIKLEEGRIVEDGPPEKIMSSL